MPSDTQEWFSQFHSLHKAPMRTLQDSMADLCSTCLLSPLHPIQPRNPGGLEKLFKRIQGNPEYLLKVSALLSPQAPDKLLHIHCSRNTRKRLASVTLICFRASRELGETQPILQVVHKSMYRHDTWL